jgi:hemoglobin
MSAAGAECGLVLWVSLASWLGCQRAEKAQEPVVNDKNERARIRGKRQVPAETESAAARLLVSRFVPVPGFSMIRCIQSTNPFVVADDGIEQQKEITMKMKFGIAALGTVLVLLGATLAAAKDSTLYQRLGGKPAISAVVDEFVGRVAADTRINGFFAATAADPKRLADFKQKLVDQICEASGGPCKYTGKDMKTAHAGMGITGAQFDALVEDLVGALDKYKVAAPDKNALLGVLGPMKKDIVEK